MATADGAQEPDKATETAQDKRELKQRLKEAKDPGEVWGIIQHVLTDLTRLEIRTVVTREMTVDGNAGTQGANPLVLSTCIDLLQADRTNTIPLIFLQEPTLAPLREFHASQVKLAQEDLQQKLDFVQHLGAAIMEAVKAFNAAKNP